MRFEVAGRSRACAARLGVVSTRHGSFQTPAFMPVGTRGAMKGVLPAQLRSVGAEICLNNTYHMLLRPGPELVARRGGVHAFMCWDGPILTDSGGYQAYSMAGLNAVDEDGVTFKSIVTGERVRLTPESATRAQNLLGADIIMAFDDCPPSVDPAAGPVNQTRLRLAAMRDAGHRRGESGIEPKLETGLGPVVGTGDGGVGGGDGRGGGAGGRVYDHTARLELALERTGRWLERCVAAHERADAQALFGIVQGGTDESMRRRSAATVTGVDLPGYAIGGVAVGETAEQIAAVSRLTAPLLPWDRPRYLMGVGYERDIVAAVCAGVDMFDCVLPTRNGRNASAFLQKPEEGAVGSGGGGSIQIRLRNARFAEDDRPLDPNCDCPACDPEGHGWPSPRGALAGGLGGRGVFTRAYVRHLFNSGEMLGPILVSLHNLRHFQRLMIDVRRAIANDDWHGLAARWPGAAAGLPVELLGVGPGAEGC